MDAIYADFQRDPNQAMALWTENSAKQFDQPVPTIVKNIYSQALKNNKQDEASDIELLAARGCWIAVMSIALQTVTILNLLKACLSSNRFVNTESSMLLLRML